MEGKLTAIAIVIAIVTPVFSCMLWEIGEQVKQAQERAKEAHRLLTEILDRMDKTKKL